MLSPILERSCLCLKAHTSLIGTIGTVKDMPNFSARKEIIAPQGVSFLRKKWCCPIGENLDTFLARITLIATPTSPILTEENDKGTFSEEESGSNSDSEPDSDSHSGSDSWSESPSEPDILSGKSSALPSQNNLSDSRKDQVAPKKTSL